MCVHTWVGMNGICGDGNLLDAYWLTDVEGERLQPRGGERVHGDEDAGMQGCRDMGGQQ